MFRRIHRHALTQPSKICACSMPGPCVLSAPFSPCPPHLPTFLGGVTQLDSLKNIGNLALARAAGGGATVSAPLGSSSAGVAAGVAAADTRELTGTSMPYDWVLKRCVRLFSNQMLQDAGILHRLPPQQGAQAVGGRVNLSRAA
eukprot:363169-Chlamydomonas_euryale.AAC.36